MSLVPLLINLVCGAVGGNGVAAVFKNLNLGTLGNSIAGIAGGGIGAGVLGMLGLGGGGEGTLDVANLVSSVASGGVGGGAVLAVVGLIKNAMAKA